MTLRDVLPFLRAWTENPQTVGAIAPSSAALADLITSEIAPDTGPVLELGAGTGVFTEALLARGLRQADLTLIEYGSDFTRMLQYRFPHARVLWMDASQLGAHDLFEGPAAGAAVSGLPLLNMSTRKLVAILSGSFRHLRPNGAFYQFTYGMTCPVPRPILDRLGLKATCIGRVLLNVPPAAVYRITRRKRSRLAVV